MNIQCSGGSRSVANESLEDEECSVQPAEVNNDQLRAVVKADSVKTTGEIDHSMVIWHLKQIGKVKKADK